MLIYPVILITQLEPVLKDIDLYERLTNLYLSAVENISNNSDPDNEDRLYEIKRFLDKRIIFTG